MAPPVVEEFSPGMDKGRTPKRAAHRGESVTREEAGSASSDRRFLDELEQRRLDVAKSTPAKHKSEFGQFMTPTPIAERMAALFAPLKAKRIRLLDAGAGIGLLTAAFTSRAAHEGADSLHCELWEIDPKLDHELQLTMEGCRSASTTAGTAFTIAIRADDFILSVDSLFGTGGDYSHAILNPPYKKIRSDSAHRHSLRRSGIETANMYSAFVALALTRLEDGGELVAITPRSFCNGSYFRPFREFILAKSALTNIHVFESRTAAFKGDEVLQENVIFRLVKGAQQREVVISVSTDHTFGDTVELQTPFDEIVLPDDREKIIHLNTKPDDEVTRAAMRKYHFSLADLGLSVSTGPVVDFRMRDHLRETREADCVPLVYAHHFHDGFVSHPNLEARKPNFIAVNDTTRKWMMPSGHYVMIRRLSSKEEKRRIVPAVFDPDRVPFDPVGFDNHTNVLHRNKAGLPADVARGLAVYLASAFADSWLRRFSGHTQVNAGDLRALRYPSLETLAAWGKGIEGELPAQSEIDALVAGTALEDES